MFIGFLLVAFCFTILPTAFAQEEVTAKEFEGKMVCKDEDVITDEQWQWYKCVVDLEESVNVYLSYEGDLDLDLRLYWKRDNFQDFNGFDLTHCEMKEDFNSSDNSQLRTTSTDDIGEREELHFDNPSYTKLADQEAFILVFAFSGEGDSDFVIESNHELIEIPDENVWHCIPIPLILSLFLIGAGAIFGIYMFLINRKKKKLTRPQKEEEKKPKEEEKLKTIDLNTKL